MITDNVTAIGTSGAIPKTIGANLQSAANGVGGVGTINAGNTVGCCAEFRVANQLMLKESELLPSNIKFTPAIRPRTMEVVPSCKNCQVIFPQLKTK